MSTQSGCPYCGHLVEPNQTHCPTCNVPLVWEDGRPRIPSKTFVLWSLYLVLYFVVCFALAKWTGVMK